MNGDRFGTVQGYDGMPIPAPVLPGVPLNCGHVCAELRSLRCCPLTHGGRGQQLGGRKG